MTEQPIAQELPLAEAAILLRPDDDVAIATRDLTPGLALRYAGGVVAVGTTVPRAHKLALRAIPAGGQVHKYGQSIGRATRDIAAGEHVHAHNLAMDNTAREHEFGTARVTPPDTMRGRTFLGYRRPDGRVGTRNFIGVITSVNCSASTARMIADQFRGIGVLDAYPHVDGVMAITHGSGCGLVPASEGGQMRRGSSSLRACTSRPSPSRTPAGSAPRCARRWSASCACSPWWTRRAAPPRTSPNWCWELTAAGRTGTPASPPTRRSASPRTSWWAPGW